MKLRFLAIPATAGSELDLPAIFICRIPYTMKMFPNTWIRKVRVDAVVMFWASLPGASVYQLAHLLDPPPKASALGPYAAQVLAQYRRSLLLSP
jgi:hypothetical protein